MELTINNKKKPRKQMVVVAIDKESQEITPYSGIKSFSTNNSDYNSDEGLRKLYNKLSRGKDFEDHRFKVVRKPVIHQKKE